MSILEILIIKVKFMDKILVKIKRKQFNSNESYYQEFLYEGDLHIPVTVLLERINNQPEIRDVNDETATPIKWSCSCLQGLCGSCSMLINGSPKLACQCFVDNEVLTDLLNKITIEPFSKFPVIEDLMVDKSVLYENMKNMQQWIDSSANINLENIPFEYDMSQCLLCGCCIEACPNYTPENLFVGVPIAVSSAKFINQEKSLKHKKELGDNYKRNFYNGCVKSLVCDDICPINISTLSAIGHMNKKSVWYLWKLLEKINSLK